MAGTMHVFVVRVALLFSVSAALDCSTDGACAEDAENMKVSLLQKRGSVGVALHERWLAFCSKDFVAIEWDSLAKAVRGGQFHKIIRVVGAYSQGPKSCLVSVSSAFSS